MSLAATQLIDRATLSQVDRDIGGAWAGGQIGMDVTERVLQSLNVCASEARADLEHFLAVGGRFYLVAVEQNRPLDILQKLRDENFAAQVS